MKYLIKMVLLLLVILLSLKLVVYLLDKGHIVNYTVGNFNIKEELKVKKVDNYYFEIKHEDFKINFQIYKNYNKKEKIISKINYYSTDGYKCILPIFEGNEILTDIMCLKGNQITYYHDMKKNKKLKKFAESLKKQGYNVNDYMDKTRVRKLSNTQVLYEDNLIDNHYIAVENYRGLSLIGSTIKTVKLFDDDVYKKPISVFVDKYYVVADYNSEYTFKKFYVVNLINGNISEIRSYNDISFDSVVQGVYGNDIYFFDKDAETQYKISLKHEMIQTVAEKDNIKDYQGKWTTMSLTEALADKTFNKYFTDDIKDYAKVDKVDGYYYAYEKDGNNYLVYRMDVQRSKIKTYLFTTSDLDSVIYLNDYIYFRKGNIWYYYSNSGVRKVMGNSELEFNDDISLGVYIET